MRMIFLGLARDCEKTLPGFFSSLQELKRYGMECSAIIGENGSRDRTRAILHQAASFGVVSVDTSEMAQHSTRLRRMAVGRQILMNAARQYAGEVDFVAVVDLDNVATKFPVSKAMMAALEKLRNSEQLFAIGATSEPYYDLLSLRGNGFDYGSLISDIAKAKRNPFTYYGFHRRKIYAEQQRVTSAIPMMCVSSFNGLCVYSASHYFEGTYISEDMDNICEHITLNAGINARTGRQLWIDSDLLLTSPSDHRPVGLFRFYLDRMISLVKPL